MIKDLEQFFRELDLFISILSNCGYQDFSEKLHKIRLHNFMISETLCELGLILTEMKRSEKMEPRFKDSIESLLDYLNVALNQANQ